ncbi:MAG: tRNA (adenosine(37)-N6)-threonylcarbamoyltransferase complex transferase subunit TsaD [Candidatus Babeliales bacterium]
MKRLILGIETSCDETAVGIYHNSRGMLANSIFSQINQHKKFGGVVPTIASQLHIQKIHLVIQEALQQAKISLSEITALAVTHKPGLPGSLIVGLCFAKTIAWALQKPLIGVNHLEGHIFSSCIEHTVPFPHLCLTASGGHTALYKVHDFGRYTLLGQTVDDAAGEAFDKIAKMLNLPYPGGPIIEEYAKEASFHDFFSYPRAMKHKQNFSFSGLKTAVMVHLAKEHGYSITTKSTLPCTITLKQQVASSLLVCIADIFEDKIQQAHLQHPDINAITFVGGVACNHYIRNRLITYCAHYNIPFFTPSPQYCTDNGGMIAFVGNYAYEQKRFNSYTLDIFDECD